MCFSRVFGRGKRIFKDLSTDLSTISHLNAKLIISTLETEQRAFRERQSSYISVTFLFTSNVPFQDRHTHFYGTFAFCDVFLTNRARRLWYVVYFNFRICRDGYPNNLNFFLSLGFKTKYNRLHFFIVTGNYYLLEISFYKEQEEY